MSVFWSCFYLPTILVRTMIVSLNLTKQYKNPKKVCVKVCVPVITALIHVMVFLVHTLGPAALPACVHVFLAV